MEFEANILVHCELLSLLTHLRNSCDPLSSKGLSGKAGTKSVSALYMSASPLAVRAISTPITFVR